eukprot:1861988-Pleurochrysis_carterae.AAC.1
MNLQLRQASCELRCARQIIRTHMLDHRGSALSAAILRHAEGRKEIFSSKIQVNARVFSHLILSKCTLEGVADPKNNEFRSHANERAILRPLQKLNVPRPPGSEPNLSRTGWAWTNRSDLLTTIAPPALALMQAFDLTCASRAADRPCLPSLQVKEGALEGALRLEVPESERERNRVETRTEDRRRNLRINFVHSHRHFESYPAQVSKSLEGLEGEQNALGRSLTASRRFRGWMGP